MHDTRMVLNINKALYWLYQIRTSVFSLPLLLELQLTSSNSYEIELAQIFSAAAHKPESN